MSFRRLSQSAPKVNYYQAEDGHYGDYLSIASEGQLQRDYEILETLTQRNRKLHETIWLRGRVHNVRVKGNACFMILRANNSATIQVAYFKDRENPLLSKNIIKFVENLTVESIVDVCGKIVPATVHSCTQKDVEINLSKIFVVSRAPSVLPFRIEDAARLIECKFLSFFTDLKRK